MSRGGGDPAGRGAPPVVVVGDLMVDVVARLDGAVAPGSDAPARIAFHGGGSAANVAAWLTAAGIQSGLAARVGADERGRAGGDELRRAGVDARLAVDPERPTGACIVLVAPDGERTMIPDAGAGDRLAPEDLPDELLGPGRHLHLAGYSLLRAGSRPSARSAMERARARGMTVSVYIDLPARAVTARNGGLPSYPYADRARRAARISSGVGGRPRISRVIALAARLASPPRSPS